jgi:hypothetical protein
VPSHRQIEIILLTKIDLLDEAQIPQSYFDFLRRSHVNRGYLKSGLGKQCFEKRTFDPRQFNDDVSNAYRRKSANARIRLILTAAIRGDTKGNGQSDFSD